jgi:hypothetical protein
MLHYILNITCTGEDHSETRFRPPRMVSKSVNDGGDYCSAEMQRQAFARLLLAR